MNVTLTDIIVLAVRRVVEEAQQSKGRYVSFKSSKLAEDILRSVKVHYSRILIRYVIKHVLDALCTELKCEKYSTSKGTVYSFDRNSILSYSMENLVKKIFGQVLH